MIIDTHKHLLYNIDEQGFPLVFVDNNPGYICYSLTPIGYKGTSLYYNGIKEAGGVNFYCTNQSIGGAIFINGMLYSLTDVYSNSWFNLSVDTEASITIFSAHRYSKYEVLVSCIVNVNPEINTLIYSSKTIDIRSMLLASNAYFYESSLTSASKIEHQDSYNEDLIYIGDGEEEFYDELTYNGAYGFSDKTIKVLEIGAERVDARKKITDEVIRDLCSLMEIDEVTLLDKGIYALETSFMEDGKIAIVGISPTNIYARDKDTEDSIEFEKSMVDYNIDNINYSNIIAIPFSKTRKEESVSYPLGVFRQYTPTNNVIFNRFENISNQEAEDEDEEINNNIYSVEYNVTLKNIDGSISISAKELMGKIVGTSSIDIGRDSIVGVENSIIGRIYSANPIPVSDYSTVLGRIHSVTHLYAEEGQIPNQAKESSALKSIALARQYSS